VLRDTDRGFDDVPVFRVDAEGKLKEPDVLSPVRLDGFVFTQADGVQLHSDGLPWWLLDMRPQGYLGRAYATRHGAELGLRACPDLSADFGVCVDALAAHLVNASAQISRLG
jgi:hypothetical protein